MSSFWLRVFKNIATVAARFGHCPFFLVCMLCTCFFIDFFVIFSSMVMWFFFPFPLLFLAISHSKCFEAWFTYGACRSSPRTPWQCLSTLLFIIASLTLRCQWPMWRTLTIQHDCWLRRRFAISSARKTYMRSLVTARAFPVPCR